MTDDLHMADMYTFLDDDQPVMSGPCECGALCQDLGAEGGCRYLLVEEPPCTDCGGTGVTYQTERRCACTLTDEERQSWQDIREGMNR